MTSLHKDIPQHPTSPCSWTPPDFITSSNLSLHPFQFNITRQPEPYTVLQMLCYKVLYSCNIAFHLLYSIPCVTMVSMTFNEYDNVSQGDVHVINVSGFSSLGCTHTTHYLFPGGKEDNWPPSWAARFSFFYFISWQHIGTCITNNEKPRLVSLKNICDFQVNLIFPIQTFIGYFHAGSLRSHPWFCITNINLSLQIFPPLTLKKAFLLHGDIAVN